MLVSPLTQALNLFWAALAESSVYTEHGTIFLNETAHHTQM